MNIRKIISEHLESILLESKVQIKDESNRGFSSQLAKVWEQGLEGLDYNKAIGTIKEEGSILDVYMNNGDKLTFIRNTNPAYGGVYINEKLVKKINSQELFSQRATDILKKVYQKSSSFIDSDKVHH